MNKTAIVYCRRSTNAQKQKHSLNFQHEACVQFAEENGYTVTKTIFESQSGRVAIREGLTAAITEAKATGAVVIVWSASRLSRSLEVWSQLNALGLDSLRVVSFGVDAPPSMIHLSIAITMATHESNQISKRTKAAFDHMKRKGDVNGWGQGKKDKAWAASKVSSKKKAREFNLSIQARCEVMDKFGATTLAAKVELLNAGSIKTRREAAWSVQSLHRVLKYQAA